MTFTVRHATVLSPLCGDIPVTEVFALHAHAHLVFTVRLHVMQRRVLLSEFSLSVRPSVRQMRAL